MEGRCANRCRLDGLFEPLYMVEEPGGDSKDPILLFSPRSSALSSCGRINAGFLRFSENESMLLVGDEEDSSVNVVPSFLLGAIARSDHGCNGEASMVRAGDIGGPACISACSLDCCIPPSWRRLSGMCDAAVAPVVIEFSIGSMGKDRSRA